jgi:CheY-like chemotaxis protein
MANVLVVDDEVAISRLLEAYLGACGHSVTSARSAVGSLGWLDLASFDVVVLDVVMPGPLNGLDVCRVLKSDSHTSKTRVLVISAVPDLEAQAYSVGADAFIPKPFNLDDISSCIGKLAGRKVADLQRTTGSLVRQAIDSYTKN